MYCCSLFVFRETNNLLSLPTVTAVVALVVAAVTVVQASWKQERSVPKVIFHRSGVHFSLSCTETQTSNFRHVTQLYRILSENALEFS